MLVVDPPRRVLNPPCTHNTPDRISTEINYVAGHFRRRVELNIRVVPLIICFGRDHQAILGY